MLSEWELWAVASRYIEEHGDMASGYASLKALELDAQGDARGHDVFMEVVARINRIWAAEGTRH